MTIILINKVFSETPLSTIKKLKILNPVLNSKKIAYAGRLDPMAEGLLLLLVEPETKNHKKYERLSKEYEFDILFGLSTDTYDILGLITKISKNYIRRTGSGLMRQSYNTKSDLDNLFSQLIGTHIQSYPPYSSARVNSKPLFWWARADRLSEISIPSKQIEIYSFEILKSFDIAKDELQKVILERLHLVTGNFRQEEIIKMWGKFFQTASIASFPILTCKISCSSGTYVRSLAHEIGERLKIGALALRIKRTKIGNYDLKEALTLTDL